MIENTDERGKNGPKQNLGPLPFRLVFMVTTTREISLHLFTQILVKETGVFYFQILFFRLGMRNLEFQVPLKPWGDLGIRDHRLLHVRLPEIKWDLEESFTSVPY